MLATKDLDNKFFDYIDPWGETLASISCAIIYSYHFTIMATTYQAVFCRDVLFKLAPVVDWRGLTAARQHQVDIDNIIENAK